MKPATIKQLRAQFLCDNGNTHPKTLALELYTTSRNGYSHVVLRPCVISNGRSTTYGVWGTFKISCQIGHFNWGSTITDSTPYAWSWEADIDASIENIGAIASTIVTVDKCLDRITEREGRPESYGQYAARICSALGAEYVIEVKDDQGGQSWTRWAPKDISWIVNQRCKDAAKSLGLIADDSAVTTG